MKKWNDLSKSMVPFEPDTSLVVVVELSQSSWLVAGRAASLDRQPIKKLEPAAIPKKRASEPRRRVQYARSSRGASPNSMTSVITK